MNDTHHRKRTDTAQTGNTKVIRQNKGREKDVVVK